jgi:hypothetical protein
MPSVLDRRAISSGVPGVAIAAIQQAATPKPTRAAPEQISATRTQRSARAGLTRYGALPAPSPTNGRLTMGDVLRLQRTIGNRAVHQLLDSASRGAIQRRTGERCLCGGRDHESTNTVQWKPDAASVPDPTAQQVTSGSAIRIDTSPAGAGIQRDLLDDIKQGASNLVSGAEQTVANVVSSAEAAASNVAQTVEQDVSSAVSGVTQAVTGAEHRQRPAVRAGLPRWR